jgi:hypothetical protein
MRSSQSSYPRFTTRAFSRTKSAPGVTSLMPTLKPRCPSHRAESLATRFMAPAAVFAPYSLFST